MKDSINIVYKEHKKIHKMIKPLVEASLKKDPILLYDEIQKVLKKLPPLVLSHFLLEENILYPAIVLNNNPADIIDEILHIQKEHGMLEQQMKQIMQFFKNISREELKNSAPLKKILISSTIALYEDLLVHEEREDKLFKKFGAE